MHPIQEKLLQIIVEQDVSTLPLRTLGRRVGVENAPQKIKHHLFQLAKKGFIRMDRKKGILESVRGLKTLSSSLISIPILGSASCGAATVFADETVEGYLQVSPKVLKKNKGIFAIQAVGNSMNRCSLHGQSIEEGDYVIIDSENRIPSSGQYVLSIVDGLANIKRFHVDHVNEHIVLVSESSSSYIPIYIHKEDIDAYQVGGVVVQVIKQPKW